MRACPEESRPSLLIMLGGHDPKSSRTTRTPSPGKAQGLDPAGQPTTAARPGQPLMFWISRFQCALSRRMTVFPATSCIMMTATRRESVTMVALPGGGRTGRGRGFNAQPVRERCERDGGRISCFTALIRRFEREDHACGRDWGGGRAATRLCAARLRRREPKPLLSAAWSRWEWRRDGVSLAVQRTGRREGVIIAYPEG